MKMRRRKWWSSVIVATVLRMPPRLVRCSIATVGGLAHGVDVRHGRRLHHAARVGVQARQIAPLAFREDDVEGQGRLPEPRGPSRHVSALCGIAAVRFLRLCSRAFDGDRALLQKGDFIERPIARVGIAGTRKGSRFFSRAAD